MSDLCAYFKTNAKIDKTTVKEYLTLSAQREEPLRQDDHDSTKFHAKLHAAHGRDLRYGPPATVHSKALPRTTTAKTAKQRAWIPFTAAEVSKLYAAALAKKKPDHALADLIAFGAYTGCRIEELAQLKAEHFSDNAFKV